MQSTELFQYAEEIINNMSEGLIIINPEGNIINVNKSYEEMTGFSKKELIGQSCTIMNCDMCDRESNCAGDKWCRLFDMKKTIKLRCLITKKNGTYLPVLKNASILRSESGKEIGAVEVLTDLSELDRLDEKVDNFAKLFDEEGGCCGMIGKSSEMQRVFELVKKAAQSEAPVIVLGESGTGKELVAQAIHQFGARKNGPYVQLNCAALNESLLESELFGHVKGAFTGAHRHRIGRFEAATHGSIFLDEIGDVPVSIQAKLLRALELQQIQRVGDHQTVHVNARLITATNKDLQKLTEAGEFREDFYFRINVIPINIPPLRERKDDIPLLINSFITSLQKRTKKPIKGLTRESIQLMMDYHWPGNIRELKSALEYAFVISDEGFIQPDQLPPTLMKSPLQPEIIPLEMIPPVDAEKESLVGALKRSKGNKSEAARILGVNRMTVWNRMKKYGFDRAEVIYD
jgi:two-component system, NtrC family, response regulator HydG